ncbi:hypothetical protein RRG08_023487 [Elysia crispata]|uniref:Uncharacterized protein n=1 Tax=Elysia crispata TaxID=231223 RepID=A0AAE0YYG2_9GAST|nr:hypothetical protein RRG08_023487 [Elysia crispata]
MESKGAGDDSEMWNPLDKRSIHREWTPNSPDVKICPLRPRQFLGMNPRRIKSKAASKQTPFRDYKLSKDIHPKSSIFSPRSGGTGVLCEGGGAASAESLK